MFDIISMAFKYLFIVIIYAFIMSIVRLIYLDISNSVDVSEAGAYLRLLNLNTELEYKLRESYFIDDKLTIGRAKKNMLVIPDKYISKEHALIFSEDDKYYIEDMDSSNGTFLNDKRVTDIVELHERDHIRIGDIEFLFMFNEV